MLKGDFKNKTTEQLQKNANLLLGFGIVILIGMLVLVGIALYLIAKGKEGAGIFASMSPILGLPVIFTGLYMQKIKDEIKRRKEK
jgi:uncharacterized membrane protein YhdT